MVTLAKDRKGATWIVTTTDREGFHHQLNMTAQQLDELVNLWRNESETGQATDI